MRSITGGGIRGRVTKVGDDEAEVEIAQGVKVRVVKSTLSQVLTPQREAGERLMLEFPALEGLADRPRHRARRAVLDSQPDRRNARSSGSWPKWLPQYKINLGLDLAGGSHLLLEADAGDARSSGSRRWKTGRDRASPRSARSTSAIFRPPAGGCPSWSAIRRRSTPRSSGCATLTQPRRADRQRATGTCRSSIRRGS